MLLTKFKKKPKAVNRKQIIISCKVRDRNRNFMTAAKNDEITMFVTDGELTKIEELISKINLIGYDIIETDSMEIKK